MLGLFKPKEATGKSSVRARLGTTVAAKLDADPRARRVESDLVQMYQIADFLDQATCQALVDLIETNRRPSTVLSQTNLPDFRTSDSCDMDRQSRDVKPTDEGIAGLLGIDPGFGETIQGQRYAPGQQFRTHHDFFDDRGPYWPTMKASGGQRTWTAMVYLNDVEEGGATWFPQAGIRVAPKRGLLLTWNNMGLDGRPNPATAHEGMPVVAGVKYIITKWFRQSAWTP